MAHTLSREGAINGLREDYPEIEKLLDMYQLVLSILNYPYKTIGWLVFMVFGQEGFIAKFDAAGLDGMIALCPFGNDMTPEQRRAFLDAFRNPALRLLVRLYWLIYRYLRSRKKIAAAHSLEAAWEPLKPE